VQSYYYRKKVGVAEHGQGRTSPDNWERWEFGNETFIDQALKEPLNDARPGSSHARAADLTVPTLEGVPSYLAAIKALRPFISQDRRAKMDKVLSDRSGRVRFVLEDPVNPSNAWACLRTLDSYGVQWVDVVTNPANYLGPDGAPMDSNPKKQRMNTAMGAQRWLDLSQHASATTCLAKLKAEGWALLATDLSDDAVPLTDLDLAAMGKFAVVLGNEDRGISDEVKALCDHKVYLPMRGFAQSFSLSVGCAAVASHLNAVGALDSGSLGPEDRARVLFRWTMESVHGARPILRRAGFGGVTKEPPARETLLGYKTGTRRSAV